MSAECKTPSKLGLHLPTRCLVCGKVWIEVANFYKLFQNLILFCLHISVQLIINLPFFPLEEIDNKLYFKEKLILKVEESSL